MKKLFNWLSVVFSKGVQRNAESSQSEIKKTTCERNEGGDFSILVSGREVSIPQNDQFVMKKNGCNIVIAYSVAFDIIYNSLADKGVVPIIEKNEVDDLSNRKVNMGVSDSNGYRKQRSSTLQGKEDHKYRSKFLQGEPLELDDPLFVVFL